MEAKRLTDLYPSWVSGGAILTDIAQGVAPEWLPSFKAQLLDIYLLSQVCGTRFASPVVHAILGESESLTSEQRAQLASIAWQLYGEAWEKVYEALTKEYNPISNYDMTEIETPAEVTETRTPAETTLTETPAEVTHTVEGGDSVFAFNSGSAQGDRVQVEEAKTTTDAAGSSAISVQSPEKTVHTTQAARELKRNGNIGVTTSQQMIESELELRRKRFYDLVCEDLKNFLTLNIY